MLSFSIIFGHGKKIGVPDRVGVQLTHGRVKDVKPGQ